MRRAFPLLILTIPASLRGEPPASGRADVEPPGQEGRAAQVIDDAAAWVRRPSSSVTAPAHRGPSTATGPPAGRSAV